MKNTTNLREDGSRWTLRHDYRRTDIDIFTAWGATTVHFVPKEQDGGRGGKIYMVQVEDGWHYAHSDENTVYMAAGSYQTPNGTSAWWAHELECAAVNRRRREQDLHEAFEQERVMADRYAKSVEAHYRNFDATRRENRALQVQAGKGGAK